MFVSEFTKLPAMEIGLLTVSVGKFVLELFGMELNRGGEVPFVPLWVMFESIACIEFPSMAVYWVDSLRFVAEVAPLCASNRMVFRLTSTELSIIDLSKLSCRILAFAA